jgi:hypothetical protein
MALHVNIPGQLTEFVDKLDALVKGLLLRFGGLPRDLLLRVGVAAVVLPLILFILWLKRVLYPTYSAREPPALYPRVPFLGHAWSLLREGGGYFDRL